MSVHFSRMRGVIPALLILSAAAYWWVHSRSPKVLATEYVGDRDVILWSTPAQVRQAVADAHYGDPMEVVRREGAASQVRTESGVLGWILDSRQLMDAALWQQSADLLARARAMPVQASGRTKTVSNVRIEPGRDARRIFQFPRGTPVTVLLRALAPKAADEPAAEKDVDAGEQKPKQEDWLLVLRTTGTGAGLKNESAGAGQAGAGNPVSPNPVSGGPGSDQSASATTDSRAVPIAGWVLARYIEPDPPGPVRDYATSTTLHPVAWFELNRVPDGSGGEAPQYLVAGTRGGEGQPCDFTMLRVYTWGARRQRYETAYVEGDLCGRLPIRVSRSADGPEFRFAQADENDGERAYVMRQTIVRRLRDRASTPSRKRR